MVDVYLYGIMGCVNRDEPGMRNWAFSLLNTEVGEEKGRREV